MKKFRITWIGPVSKDAQFDDIMAAERWAQHLARETPGCRVVSIIEEGKENEPVKYKIDPFAKAAAAARTSVDSMLPSDWWDGPRTA